MENLTVYKSPYEKFRVGSANDGGYVLVRLPGTYDAFFSGGISNDIRFEEDFLRHYPDLVCHAYDGTIPALPRTSANIVFHRQNLGNTNDNGLTNLHQELSPYNDVFLKLDIEGHEFRLLPTFFPNIISKVKQLVIEIHSPGDIHLHPGYFRGLQDIYHADMWRLFQELQKTHTLVHIHGNNGCDIHTVKGVLLPNVFECTFIRNEFVGNREWNDTPFPTLLDSPNIPSKPDLQLEGWPYSTPRR
jgi:hypothetical protein